MKRKDYRKPTARVVNLQHRTMLLQASSGTPTQAQGAPTYNGFNASEKDWE